MITPNAINRRSNYGLNDAMRRAITEIVDSKFSTVDIPVIGEVRMFDIQPDKIKLPWLFCDGRLVSQLEFPMLFSAIGHQHAQSQDEVTGYDTSFRLPDYRGKIPKGVPVNTGNNVRVGQVVEEVVDLDVGTTLSYIYAAYAIRAM